MRDLSGWGFTTCGGRLRQHCNPPPLRRYTAAHGNTILSSQKILPPWCFEKGGGRRGGGFDLGFATTQSKAAAPKGTFVLCLNTSTIRGRSSTHSGIDLAAKAGFTAMEPWVGEIGDHVKAGGDLKDLKKRFADNGLAVVDAIGFAPWLMGDEAVHKKGLESMKRHGNGRGGGRLVRIAAPPMGAQMLSNFDLNLAAGVSAYPGTGRADRRLSDS